MRALVQVTASTGGGAGAAFQVQAGVSLVAGAAVIKYLTQVVDTHGLGEGAGLLIATGIALSESRSLAVRSARAGGAWGGAEERDSMGAAFLSSALGINNP